MKVQAIVLAAGRGTRMKAGEKSKVMFAIQEKAEGTADAVQAALPYITNEIEHVIVLYGDHSTFYTKEVLQELLDKQAKTKAAMTLITTHTDPKGYGRILRDKRGEMVGIVEEKNASEEQRKITEINTGNAVYSTAFLKKYLPLIQRNSISGEYYFTDIVSLGFDHHEKIETLVVEDAAIGMGINTPEQLQAAEAEMKKRNA
jgi:bifunctional UDP-N-acetylglucosamine pyrophosphorylase/glucosamine-1-phosphate N-acetyltransferase